MADAMARSRPGDSAHRPVVAVLLAVSLGYAAGNRPVVGIAVTGFCSQCARGGADEGTIGLVPRFHFVWEPSANERLAAYLERQPTKEARCLLSTRRSGPRIFRATAGPTSTVLCRSPAGSRLERTSRHASCGSTRALAATAASRLREISRSRSSSVMRGKPWSATIAPAAGSAWAYGYGVYYKDPLHMGDGPRRRQPFTTTTSSRIGASGDLVCLDAEGKKQWSANVLSDAKAKNIKWGLSGSPLIVDDVVVAHAGIDDDAPANSALIAYEQATGHDPLADRQPQGRLQLAAARHASPASRKSSSSTALGWRATIPRPVRSCGSTRGSPCTK